MNIPDITQEQFLQILEQNYENIKLENKLQKGQCFKNFIYCKDRESVNYASMFEFPYKPDGVLSTYANKKFKTFNARFADRYLKDTPDGLSATYASTLGYYFPIWSIVRKYGWLEANKILASATIVKFTRNVEMSELYNSLVPVELFNSSDDIILYNLFLDINTLWEKCQVLKISDYPRPILLSTDLNTNYLEYKETIKILKDRKRALDEEFEESSSKIIKLM